MTVRGKTIALLLLMMVPALAVPVADTFSNPVMEARARALQRQLRCLVCQAQSIDESNADLAADMRHLVRAQMRAGKTDQEIEDFLVARYGDFVLMRPPVQSDTWLLWLAPFLVLGAGGAVAWVTVKKAGARGA
jgi:cytochrome c-type biogenesis protein CcmH